jgi:hypothetical protein
MLRQPKFVSGAKMPRGELNCKPSKQNFDIRFLLLHFPRGGAGSREGTGTCRVLLAARYGGRSYRDTKLRLAFSG